MTPRINWIRMARDFLLAATCTASPWIIAIEVMK